MGQPVLFPAARLHNGRPEPSPQQLLVLFLSESWRIDAQYVRNVSHLEQISLGESQLSICTRASVADRPCRHEVARVGAQTLDEQTSPPVNGAALENNDATRTSRLAPTANVQVSLV